MGCLSGPPRPTNSGRLHIRGRAANLVLGGLSLLGVAACGAGSDGGEAEPVRWTLPPTPTLSIGEVDGDPRYLFSGIRGAAALPGDRIAVADGGDMVVRVYGPDGTFEREFGGKGEGPGEFAYISSMDLVAPDTLELYDGSLFRLTRFLADGTLVSTTPIVAEGGRPETFAGRLEGGGLVFSWIRLGTDYSGATSVADPMQIGRFGPDGALIEVIAEAAGMRRARFQPVPFSPFYRAFTAGDSILVGNGMRPGLTVLSSAGDSVRFFGIPARAPDPDSARTGLRAALEAAGDSMRLGILDGAAVEPTPEVAVFLRHGPRTFWMKPYRPATDSWLAGGADGSGGGEWALVDMDGDVRGWLDVPAGIAPLVIRDDVLLGVQRDELGVERIVRYDLRVEPTESR